MSASLLHSAALKGASQPPNSLVKSAEQFSSTRLILWPELKVTTALGSLSSLVKHEAEESSEHSPVAMWVWAPAYKLQVNCFTCISIKGFDFKAGALLDNELCWHHKGC